MNKNLAENYVFMLNLCHQPDCTHPLCGSETVKRHSEWYENGPPLTYVPVPIPDPKRPWGGECNECASFCTGHYLKPKEHADFVKENGNAECMYTPHSVVMKEEFYESIKKNRELSNTQLQKVPQKTLLSLEELNMHVDNLRTTAQRRKEGAKKAASTRKAKKAVSEYYYSTFYYCNPRLTANFNFSLFPVIQ